MVTNTSSTPAPLHPPCGNARRTAWRAWWHWTVMVALGEVVGFGIPVLIGASAYALRLPESILHSAVIVGGMGEGMVLGLAQWLVLRQYVPRLSARAWVLATGAGALLAWVIGMGVANVGPTVWQRSPPLFITVAGVLTVVFLLSMGGGTVARVTPPRRACWLVDRCQCAGVAAGRGRPRRRHGACA